MRGTRPALLHKLCRMKTAFLASTYLSGMSSVLPSDPPDLRTVFVPTAGGAYPAAPWIDRDREWLAANGFAFTELDLQEREAAEVETALQNADLVYVAGGNTYFLLQEMKRTNFFEIVCNLDAVYVGASAGAIVLCPDIAYIADLDDRALAPDLEDTRGAGVVDFRILPHMDDVRIKPQLDRIIADWRHDMPLVKLTDAEAVAWNEGRWRVVSSPQGDLPARAATDG